MKYLSKVSFLIFLFPLFASAQSNYKPAYVVTLRGDTLHGNIDYQEWEKNPIKIRFKTVLNKAAEVFSTEHINAFGISNLEYYESYSLQVSQGQVDVQKLSTGVDTSKVTQHVFLQLIDAGKNVNLYRYKDDIKTRYFIKERSSATPVELTYQVYLNPADVTQIVTQTKFQNQLHLLAIAYNVSDETLFKKIRLAEYNEQDITGIINTINGVKKQETTLNKHSSVNFFAGVGIIKGSLNYTGAINLAKNSTSSRPYLPQVSLGMNVPLNPNIGRFILRVELFFNNGNYKVWTTQGLYASHQFSSFTSGIAPQFIYNIYNTQPLKFYIAIGAAFNFSSYSNNVYRYAQEAYSGETVKWDNYPEMASWWVSSIGKAGVILNKRYELYIGYSPYAAVTDHYLNFSGAVNGIQTGFNFLFK